MRKLLVLVTIVLVAVLAGWISGERTPGKASITIETAKIAEDTKRALEAGKRMLQEGRDSIQEVAQQTDCNQMFHLTSEYGIAAVCLAPVAET